MLDGKPVIEQTLLSLKNADIRDIIVVTGAREAEIRKALQGHKVTFVQNKQFEQGMASSLVAGISALNKETDQVLICLGDMPFVAPESYKRLMDASSRISEAEIFAPRFKGKRGNPALWRKTQFDALRALTGDKGGRLIMHRNPEALCDVPVDDPGVLIDLDTPEALEQFGIRVTGP